MYPTENYKIMMEESVWVEMRGCREFAKTKKRMPLLNRRKYTQMCFQVVNACSYLRRLALAGHLVSGHLVSCARKTWSLRIAVIIFTILVAVVLLNLLVAQLNMAYKLAHADMEGYARLTRASIIVTTVEQVSRKRWRKFLARLGITWLWLEDAQRTSKGLLCLFVR